METLNVNEIREFDAKWSGFELPNFKLTFYYDETGNCRKFYLNENGINSIEALKHDYILGGICYEGTECPADVELLFTNLKLQPTLKELKFKNLINKNKDFFDCLNENRLSTFLNWLNNSSLYLHFSTVNNFYYSIVDIVDCFWESQPQFFIKKEWIYLLKSAIYHFAINYINEFIAIFIRYGYPNITRVRPFCMEIANLIDSNIMCIQESFEMESFFLESFKQMIKYHSNQDEMCFLKKSTTGLLIDEYFMFRISRCCLYKNSFHFFDEESVDERKMGHINLSDNGTRLINYKFLNSVDNKLIQISDGVAGLFAKLFKYLDETSEKDFIKAINNATSRQQRNLEIINNLIDRSEKKHITLLHNANDINLVNRRGHMMEIMGTTSSFNC